MIKYSFSGTSHGEGYCGVIEGLPSGVVIDTDYINSQLALRKGGYGRSSRQSIEQDLVVFEGLIDSRTTSAPLKFIVSNARHAQRGNITALRASHIDVIVASKFGTESVREHNELASARSSLCYVVVGAIARQLLLGMGITISSSVSLIGGESNSDKHNALIDNLRAKGDSIGGIVSVTASGVPMGVGSYFPYENRLDGIISHSMMSIPSVKGILWGVGMDFSELSGSQLAETIAFNSGSYSYTSNNCGGIIGGMTTGGDINFSLVVRPIPTVKGVQTIDSLTHETVPCHYERADTCVVDNVGVIASNMLAIALYNVMEND